ncbi:MAG: TonB-dependent receptor [Cyclobacteriaceae bacterium]|nr:TonB-dependent receptor [Cyclobacteriaceae bacterium]
MNEIYKKFALSFFIVLGCSLGAYAQSTVSGTVKDGSTNETLAGVNIVVKGLVVGTITDLNGQFKLNLTQSPPFTLSFSFIGFASQELQITEANTSGLEIVMEEQYMLGQEVVVSASRVEESILQSPVTIEKMDITAIKQAATPDFYDALANVKGVQVNSGSMNFTAVNTRGFATIANTRFVQLVDGMDTQAPLLNFPTGNIVGIGELDVESVELVPGAASALYGPNAFNGILIMKSKSPFEYQGLSAQLKAGITNSDAGESNPLTQYSLRYAKAFNNKFAFKVNFSLLQATDWTSNDYKTSRVYPSSETDLSGNPNFDGLNTYGDEAVIPVPIGGTFGTLDLRRTGFKEEDMLESDDVKSIKGDVALHYRINDRVEALYNFRYGGGSSIYQGTEKYILRDFSQQFHKLELKADNWFVRGYMTATDAGDSYNLSALGAFANESIAPTAAQWAPEYANRYVLALQGYIPGVPAGNQSAAHSAARTYADRNRPADGSQAFEDLMNTVRNRYFQRNPPGASFLDDSRLYHAEFNYNFADKISFAEVQVGGNFRQYNLFSSGTIFNEAPTDGVNFERIPINEYGMYVQVAKTLAEKLKLAGLLRYDKNENFDGRITPRLSAVYEAAKNHNIRASFQTGFRNPDTQAQFIYFPSSSGILLGSTEANAARYGVHNGGGYTDGSYSAYRASGGSLDPTTGATNGGNPALLVTADIPYVAPERLHAYELGYKGVFNNKVLIDLNGYYTEYNDFIGAQIVAAKSATSHQGNPLPAGTRFSLYNNSVEKVKSYGVGLGMTYSLPRNFTVNGNWSWAYFEADESPDFRAGFNTPRNKVSFGLGNRKIVKNLGFNVNYRWQHDFLWQSSYGEWVVPEFGVIDAQLNYKVSSIKSTIKVGGTNIGGGDYRTNLGAPFVGQQYYISITFDEFFN